MIAQPLKIKVANKKGYQEAVDGDAIRLYQPNSETQRGRVGKGVAHTLETTGQQGVVQPKMIGYTRDAKGKVTDRHLKDEAGTIHSSSGQGGNTDQYVQQGSMIKNPLKGKTDYGWHFEQNVFTEDSHTRALKSSEGSGNKPKVIQDYRIRRLTPVECERLQGFPDNHTEYGIYDGEVKKMSNTQRYKQCGNAVTVDVVKAVAQQLIPIYNA